MSDIKSSINQVIEEQNIPFEWSQIIFDELENIIITFSDSRVDLTNKPFITIDGRDAKDFDDAVLCEKNIEGFSLWVAIADVAEVVNKNSEIDKEAFKRGTSIYFPNTVVPMLPEKISNNICSLVPNEKRNVLVCEINFNMDAEINSYNFFEAIICSAHRFTYKEVLEYTKGDSEIINSLESLKILTNKLLKNRQKRSALEIESQEPSLIISDNGILKKLIYQKDFFLIK
jgi:ribonuclease R